MSERRILTPRNIAVGVLAAAVISEGAIILSSKTPQETSFPSANPTGIVEPGSFSPNPISTPRILYPTNSAAATFNPTDSSVAISTESPY